MKKGTTVLLGLLAVGAVIFLAVYEPLTRSTREEVGDGGLAVQMDPAGIEDIKIVTGDEYFEIKRHGEGWQVGPDPVDRADAAEVARLLQAVSQVPYFDRIRESELPDEKSLNEFGLRNPRRRLELAGPGGRMTLFFGKDAANDERLYLRTDKSRNVYVVGDGLLTAAFRRANDFRDRRLSDLGPEQIERVVIRQKGGELELRHGPSGWRLVKPLDAPADEEKVRHFLGDLLGLQIGEFLANDSGDLGAYGLHEGEREIVIYPTDSDRSQTLRLGEPSFENAAGLPAQFTARDFVYRLPRKAADLLAILPETFRDRRLLPVNLDVVDVIRITSPAGKIDIDRQGEEWAIRSGEKTLAVDAAAVQKLVNVLGSTTVEKYLPTNAPGTGTSAPRATVEFLSRLSENTPETSAGDYPVASVAFFDGPDGELLARVSQGPEYAVVPATVLEAMPLNETGWLTK